MLLHQGVGLETFNELPSRRAVHAVYECANSLELARALTDGRPYPDHDALLRRADDALQTLPDPAVDAVLDACPDVGSRPGSVRSAAEGCALSDDDEQVMARVRDAARRYRARFGFGFVMHLDAGHDAAQVLAALTERLRHDRRTERAVLRGELAHITRTRLERMLGPEGGYQNW